MNLRRIIIQGFSELNKMGMMTSHSPKKGRHTVIKLLRNHKKLLMLYKSRAKQTPLREGTIRMLTNHSETL